MNLTWRIRLRSSVNSSSSSSVKYEPKSFNITSVPFLASPGTVTTIWNETDSPSRMVMGMSRE